MTTDQHVSLTYLASDTFDGPLAHNFEVNTYECPRCIAERAIEASRGNTPRRTVRIDDELWGEAQSIASERGDNLSDVIREALRRYVESVTP